MLHPRPGLRRAARLRGTQSWEVAALQHLRDRAGLGRALGRGSLACRTNPGRLGARLGLAGRNCISIARASTGHRCKVEGGNTQCDPGGRKQSNVA
jgi:hypothetical protein